jgi:hypothetical protein
MYYIYQIPPSEDFEGTVNIVVENKEVNLPLNTPEDLWKAVSKLG